MQILVEKFVKAPIAQVWQAYTSPQDIQQWNAASDDWHTTHATVDLREGGAFNFRMEAKDGSFGFDFAGTYTRIIPHACIAYVFGDRTATVEFTDNTHEVLVRVRFDPETQNPLEMQREGWQAILNNFAKFVETRA